jgi:hypothetical protein
VDRSSLTAADFHRLLSAGLPAHVHVPEFSFSGATTTRPNGNVGSRLIAGQEIDQNGQQHGFLLAK